MQDRDGAPEVLRFARFRFPGCAMYLLMVVIMNDALRELALRK